jgi:hypothetical protein
MSMLFPDSPLFNIQEHLFPRYFVSLEFEQNRYNVTIDIEIALKLDAAVSLLSLYYSRC